MLIKLMGLFSHLAGAREIEIKVEGKRRVGDILREVIPRFDEIRDKIIIVNGKVASEDVEVGDNDIVKLMPVLSGG
ncbi:MoaD/ThiS family protein [Pyrococcus kukulkanii]|uniref:Molybdopterin converting factor, subunit 1 n=1 Tax=Pyrococcus kukulkanii TaxID=1609559 RepID=A0A127BB79_9EURY|nr:MoaD/ThiS family protein [Pyrococcus kukulkanii]AMM54582.1 molybdopterin converting factor, subunit 1 [Pyrococcus kukulkanii]